MTTTPSPHLRLTSVDTVGTIHIELHGDLDYDNSEYLRAAVTTKLAEHPDLDDLHLHCAGLGAVDSMGLSILLMVHRQTSAAGVRFHLEDRPANLDRLLTLTGTLEHFTSSPSSAARSSFDTEPLVTNGKATTARPNHPDSTD